MSFVIPENIDLSDVIRRINNKMENVYINPAMTGRAVYIAEPDCVVWMTTEEVQSLTACDASTPFNYKVVEIHGLKIRFTMRFSRSLPEGTKIRLIAYNVRDGFKGSVLLCPGQSLRVTDYGEWMAVMTQMDSIDGNRSAVQYFLGLES